MIGKNLLRGLCLFVLFVSGAVDACVIDDTSSVLGWQHLAVLAIVQVLLPATVCFLMIRRYLGRQSSVRQMQERLIALVERQNALLERLTQMSLSSKARKPQ
jgi:hypothetical protein